MTKAVRIHVNGGPEVLRCEDIALPPPGAGEARVRQSAIGVNFSDINVRRGGFYIARPQQFPLIPGNEAAGVVESVGPGATDVQPGDRVAYAGMRGEFFEDTGAYAEMRNVPSERLVKLPDAIKERQAAAMLVNYGNASGHPAPLDLLQLAKKGSLSVSRPALSRLTADVAAMRAAAAELFDLVQRRALTIEIGASFPLADAAAAHRAVEQRIVAGSVL